MYYYNNNTKETKWELGVGESCQDAEAAPVIVGSQNPERQNDNTAVATRQGKHHDSGWVEMQDPVKKKTYYFNKKTKKTAWTKPAELVALEQGGAAGVVGVVGAAGGAAGGAAIAPGWVAVADPTSGDTYWYHGETRQTTWDQPTA